MFGVKIFELHSDKVGGGVMYHSRSRSPLELCGEIALNGPRCHYLTCELAVALQQDQEQAGHEARCDSMLQQKAIFRSLHIYVNDTAEFEFDQVLKTTTAKKKPAVGTFLFREQS